MYIYKIKYCIGSIPVWPVWFYVLLPDALRHLPCLLNWIK